MRSAKSTGVWGARSINFTNVHAKTFHQPVQARAKQTRKLILDTAGQLLAEVGFDKLTTNLICERAGLTPPALYNYFPNKYAIVEELGGHLTDEHREITERWMQAQDEFPLRAGQIAILLELLHENNLSNPNSEWIFRSVRGMKQQSDQPLFTMEIVSNLFAEWLFNILPDVDRELIEIRFRIASESAFGVLTMLLGNPDLNASMVCAEAGEMLEIFLGGIINNRHES